MGTDTTILATMANTTAEHDGNPELIAEGTYQNLPLYPLLKPLDMTQGAMLVELNALCAEVQAQYRLANSDDEDERYDSRFEPSDRFYYVNGSYLTVEKVKELCPDADTIIADFEVPTYGLWNKLLKAVGFIKPASYLGDSRVTFIVVYNS